MELLEDFVFSKNQIFTSYFFRMKIKNVNLNPG